MLDNETKLRINTARDILVGKVPDPKSQVEQITIALIYKFMDDMDLDAEELGGDRKFFTEEYEQYAWHKLFAPQVGGEMRLNLYSEALLKLSLNPNLPQLFRDIFKNAYLPYRDPETLTSFLKEIDKFKYDHSERLGDAFEYLLSVLGSQGDAGQFRTPRHLIDFMAAIIDPRKDETILDPACGTAGFLIASYKRILQKNSSNYDPKKDPAAFELHGISLDELGAANGKKYRGDQLTPDDRKRMAQNFMGYDISPDMVRLSLVNLYLHGFTDPHIYEYDTLTSEARWNEYYDIILANPPFMSPKGGIKPHKRFSIASNRSEVLFVDYIAEHLTTNGRAAIIVPEGIVFQAGTAYKSLRKMLVDEDYLVGVISLPAGVFNPYSGVKTSILWIDKALAKKTDKLLFVKIENDGFDLGAQRRPLKTSDLPEAFRHIEDYKLSLQIGEVFDAENLPNVTVVDKVMVAENGDYGLSGEKYKIVKEYSSNFPTVELKEICILSKGSPITKKDTTEGIYPVIAGGQTPAYYHNQFNREGETITVSSSGAYAGFLNYFEIPIFASDCTTIQVKNKNEVLGRFLFHLLKTKQDFFYSLQQGGGQPHVYSKDFASLKIPVPPVTMQAEIVREIEAYQRIIEGAQQVVESYQPRIEIDAEWEIVELGEMAEFRNGINYTKDSKGEVVKVVGVKDFQDNLYIITNELEEVQVDGKLSEESLLKENDILFVRSNGNPNLIGRSLIYKGENGRVSHSGFTIKMRLKSKKIIPDFLIFLLKTEFFRKTMIEGGTGANIKSLSQGILANLKIPLPDLPTQQTIIDAIERERTLVTGCKELVGLYKEKIRRRIARVWGEEENAPLNKKAAP